MTVTTTLAADNLPPREPAARRALIDVGVGALLIGAAPVLVRFSDSAPAASAFWRLALAVPFALLPVLAGTGAQMRRDGAASTTVWCLALLTGVFFAADLLLFHTAIGMTSVANSTVIVNAAPVLLPLLVWLLDGRRPGLAAMAALMLASAGVLVLAWERLDGAAAAITGDLLAVGAGGAYAVYLWLVRRVRAALSTGAVMAAGNAVGALCLGVAVLVEGVPFQPASWSGAAAILGLVLLGQVLGQGLIARGLGTAPADAASALLLLPPVATAALAWIALGETLSPLQAGGATMVLVAVFMAARRPSGRS